ncbi:ABC transporter permease [Leucobacter luti]|uniref:ABC-type transport system involved in multi-copper enzyme maturation permease subunit n=1 Tax=Leucobacter luti TaxID=340320 RepID=A0A4Q7U1S3_9MICO|nr:ABC transporter permease [Leucobacter luti]MBL3699172.1 ABC transporter permease [Leucobacter luti]RZT66670.1 ABC-type transport system involved in multi-copper enzyme maturation permease subunit [Leucobacter luti]
MSRLTRSLSAEWRKVRSTKLWWVLGIVLAGYSAMMAAVFAFMFGSLASEMGGVALPDQDAANLVYSSVSTFGYVIPLLFGALMATGELRHRTLGLAFTIEPRRGIVLLSKVLVLIGVGILFGVFGVVGAAGAGGAILSTTGGDPMLGTADTWALIARIIAAIGIWAAIGFGVGVLVRNQAFAIVLTLVFTQFIEPVARLGASFWDWSAQLAKFLPGAASDAFVGASVMNSMSEVDPTLPDSAQPLGIWGGLAVLAAYAVVAVVVGWVTRWRRDVA